MFDEASVESQRIYIAPAVRDYVEWHVEAANRKAERLGLSGGYSVEFDGPFLRRPAGEVLQHEVLRVTISGGFVLDEAHAGFVPVGVAERLSGTDEVLTYGDFELSEGVDFGWCDECGTRRDRVRVVQVRDSNNVVRNVGGACAERYVGVGGVQGLVDLLTDPAQLLGEFDDDANPGWRSPSRTVPFIPVKVALGVARVVMVSEGGEFFRSSHDKSTAKATEKDLLAARREWALHPDVVAEVDALLVWLAAEKLAKGDKFLRNLKAVASADLVSLNQLALLVSAWSGFDRHVRAGDSNPLHVGVVGERLRGLRVTVTDRGVEQAPYGDALCLWMVTEDGCPLFVRVGGDWPQRTIDRGSRLVLDGTVKAHAGHLGSSVTVLQRPKVQGVW